MPDFTHAVGKRAGLLCTEDVGKYACMLLRSLFLWWHPEDAEKLGLLRKFSVISKRQSMS
jgi:hypothetical protein